MYSALSGWTDWEGRGGEGRGGEGRGGMIVIGLHIVIGMFNSNPMIPHYLNNNLR